MERRPQTPSRIPIPRSPSPAARSRTLKILKAVVPSKAKSEAKAQAATATRTSRTQPGINVNVAGETTTKAGGANAPTAAPIISVGRGSSRASSTSPVPSITISIPDSPEQKQPPSPPSTTSGTPSSTGGLHPRRARSLSAGSSRPSVGKEAATDMSAMAVLCGVPEHGKAVNTIRDLKSEIEELNERVEQGEEREDEFAALAQREREAMKLLEEREAEAAMSQAQVEQGQKGEIEFAALVHREKEGRTQLQESQAEVASLQAQVEQMGKETDAAVQSMQAQVEQAGRERDVLLRAKRSAVRELDRLKRERQREKRVCSVAEHSTLYRRLRALEREREEAAKAGTCSMPVHDEFLRMYADKVKEMDRDMLALTAKNEKLLAREVCTLPIHTISLQEYKDQVTRMDGEIQAKDKLLEEKDAAIAAARRSSRSQEDNAEERETQAARLKACEERLENHKAKFRKDIESAIDELARQERDTDAWIANIAQRDLYTREITDEDLESMHKLYQDRTNGLRQLKKTMLGASEQRVEREHEEQRRRLRQWLQKREDVVDKATAVIERLQTALKERDVEMIALKKGAKISIDQSKIRPDHFDVKWELDDKYYGLRLVESHLKHIDQDQMLQEIEAEIGVRVREEGGVLTRSTGGASRD